MSFSGFPSDLPIFLADLRENNDKDWFAANRERYEASLAGPAKEFVAAIAEPLLELSPTLAAEPAVNKSIFRINRDTRFSKDKTPYKDHLDMMFWDGEGRSRDCAALFVRVTSDRLYLGAGKHGFSKEELDTWREAVQTTAGEELVGILDELRAQGFDVGGEHYKSVPRGLPKDHPRAELLKYNGLHAFREAAHPAELFEAGCIDHVVDVFRPLTPLLLWVRDNVCEPAK